MSDTDSLPSLPDDMTRVTKEQFFSALTADPRDIMPSHRQRLYTIWETRDGVVFGWSSPGWQNPGSPVAYALRRPL